MSILIKNGQPATPYQVSVADLYDVVIWNPLKDHTISASTHHIRLDYSMCEGLAVVGNAKRVISRGDVSVDRNTWLGTPSRGKFQKRQRFSMSQLNQRTMGGID